MKQAAKARTRSKTTRLGRTTLLDDLGALALFTDVVQSRSFTATGKRHGIGTSAVSKRITALEQSLGVRLIERTTRSAVPSEAGLSFYEHCQRLLAAAAAAEESVLAHRGALAGTLRVSAPVTFGQMHVAPLVTRFLAQHRELRIQLSLSDQSVDLVAAGVDVALRSGRVVDSNLVSKKLVTDRRIVCATPAYLAEHGAPRAPVDLLSHRCLRHSLMAPAGGWAFNTPDGTLTLPVTGPLEVDNVAALRDAALASLGITLLPRYAVAAELRSGDLISLLGDFVPESPPFRALWLPHKQPLARVTAFVEFLASELPKRA